MERDTIEVALSPVSPLVPGFQGAVELYEVPAYDDIATLYLDDTGRWLILHFAYLESIGVRSTVGQMPAFLSEGGFREVLDSITAHAA